MGGSTSGSVVPGGPAGPVAPAARRLVLSAPELALLVQLAEVRLPPSFDRTVRAAAHRAAHRDGDRAAHRDGDRAAHRDGDRDGDRAANGAGGLDGAAQHRDERDELALRAAAGTLAAGGIVVPGGSGDPFDCRPTAPVLANLATLAAPDAVVEAEVSLPGGGLRGVYAVRGLLGASLFTLADGAVELSMFAAVNLGRELIRAVPPLAAAPVPGPKADEALLSTPTRTEPLRGRLPLAALALDLDPGLASLAAPVAQRTTGVLRCVVLGAIPAGGAVGQVLWLATDAGWTGLRPDPDGSGQRMVALQPVVREDIGSWLAPYLAQILEASDG